MLRNKDATVDMYEQLPVPFGLVRFGVAPDHPEVKNCQDKFEEVASSPRFNFIGNTDIGRDLPLSSLVPHYDAILFAYGASKDRRLNTQGEDDVDGIYSARAFVGWYNGLPEYANLSPKLDAGEEAVIVGQGNVALDVARTLLSDLDRLRTTDISEHALEALAKSKIKRVHVVGRRGPLQASFTIKEIRELMTLPKLGFDGVSADLLPSDPSKLPRVQKRLTQLLMKGSTLASPAEKSWALDFCLSPTSFNSNTPQSNHLRSITFARTAFQSPDHTDPKATVQPTDQHITMPASAAFRSIGYKSEAIPGMQALNIPFNATSGTIPNANGGRILALSSNVKDQPAEHLPGMYCSGWVKNGPTGVIATTMEDAFATAEAIAEDWANDISLHAKDAASSLRGRWDGLKRGAGSWSLRPVSWEDWRRIDAAERERGRARGKQREKFTSTQQMLEVLD
ncbi:NADPH-adrenodoxin reductase [Lambiella insularis]|nr:NADPH-adrenodoxin reductase [Lambiella insularis]